MVRKTKVVFGKPACISKCSGFRTCNGLDHEVIRLDEDREIGRGSLVGGRGIRELGGKRE
jgi:hypothetical protein